MLASMTAREFQEWRVYLKIEPSGEAHMDWRFAQLCHLIATAHLKREDRRAFRLADFLPDLRSREEREAFAEAERQFNLMKLEAEAKAAKANGSGGAG